MAVILIMVQLLGFTTFLETGYAQQDYTVSYSPCSEGTGKTEKPSQNYYDSSLPEYTITENLLSISKYTRPGKAMKEVRAIVVHWVGNPNTTAIANRNYFESLKAGKKDSKGKHIKASAHYIVGLDGEVIGAVPKNEIAIHAGPRNTPLSKEMFPNDANYFCMGIESCHLDEAGNYNNKTYTTLVRLTADLLNKYNLPTETGLLRHNDISTKNCPRLFVNSDNWEWCTEPNEFWEQFKTNVEIARERK